MGAQVPLGDYVADFACLSAKLIVELDGSQHVEPEQAAFDAKRYAYFKAAGFGVLRITTGDFFREHDSALDTIWNALDCKM
jgi:very-short-patch-repair endonuclease